MQCDSLQLQHEHREHDQDVEDQQEVEHESCGRPDDECVGRLPPAPGLGRVVHVFCTRNEGGGVTTGSDAVQGCGVVASQSTVSGSVVVVVVVVVNVD